MPPRQEFMSQIHLSRTAYHGKDSWSEMAFKNQNGVCGRMMDKEWITESFNFQQRGGQVWTLQIQTKDPSVCRQNKYVL